MQETCPPPYLVYEGPSGPGQSALSLRLSKGDGASMHGMPLYLTPTGALTDAYHSSYDTRHPRSDGMLLYPAGSDARSYPASSVAFDDVSYDTSPAAQSASVDDVHARETHVGIYPDRAPDRSTLNAAQLAIANEYSPQLDEGGTSLAHSFLRTSRDWRRYVRWQFWRTCFF